MTIGGYSLLPVVILFNDICHGETIINVLKIKLFVIVRRSEMILFLRNGLDYRNSKKLLVK